MLRNLVKLDPNNGAGHQLLGSALLHSGDAAGAAQHLQRALDLAVPAREVAPLLTQAWLRSGQSQRLVDAYAHSTLDEPSAQAELRAAVGAAWLNLGDTAKAGAAFDEALSAAPRHRAARVGQARVALQQKRLDAAKALIDDLLANEPRDAQALVVRAQLQLARGDDSGAIESLQAAVAADPADPTAAVALVSLLTMAQRFEQAQTALTRIDQTATADPRLVYLRALVALRRGSLPQAREEIARLLQRAPDHVPALTLAGEVELRAANLGAAETSLKRALRADPSALNARSLLVATHLRQGRPGQAVDALQPLLAQPEMRDPRLLMLAGEAYLAGGETERAAEYFERAKALGATTATAQLRLGQIALAKGDIDKGIDELHSATAGGSAPPQADLLLAAMHLRRNEPDKALQVARRLIENQPGNPLGHVLAGKAHQSARRFAEAKTSFEAALKIQRDFLPALRGLADLDLAQGRPIDASRRLEALADKNADEHLLVSLAEVQERGGDVPSALATLRKAVKLHPHALAANAALVQFHLRRKDRDAAVAAARDASFPNAEQPRFVELLGITQESAGALDDAAKTFRSLTRLEPQNPMSWLRLAAVLAKQDDLPGAAANLVQARKILPDNESMAHDLVAVYLGEHKPAQALAVARDLQTRKRDSPIGHVLEGNVYLEQRRWADAESAYRQSLKIDIRSSTAAIGLQRALSLSGRKALAKTQATEWIASHPADIAFREQVADAAMRAKDYDTAARHYEALTELQPGSALALAKLATALGKRGDRRALAVAERAVALAPNHVSALDALGMVQIEVGDPRRGLEVLARLRGLAPERPDLRLHHAIGLMRIGRSDEARAELRALLALQEDFAGKDEIPALLVRR